MSAAPNPKRSKLDIHFAIRKSHRFDPPISREILGEPNTVKIHTDDNQPPKVAVMRSCRCVECGAQFSHHEASILCPDCQEAIDLAVSLTATLPDGNLPDCLSRTVGHAKPVSSRGVRPKVLGDEPK